MNSYISRFISIGTRSCFIFGPRGTGKSTFLKNQFPNAYWIDLRLAEQYRKLKSNPDLLITLVEERPLIRQVIIDEIQRIPELLPIIHSLIESNKKIQYILTGSSARKLKKEGVDLLAGRAIRKEMHPFMISELQANKVKLDEYIQYGLLPLAYEHDVDEKKQILDSYVSLYMEQEVYQESLVRNIGDFTRFLETISFSHGSILNVSNIARDCMVNRKTVESYIKILEDILLGFTLPVFAKKRSRELTVHPKFYFFDSGVFNTLRPKGPLDNPNEIKGYATEGLVAQQLKAYLAYSNGHDKLFFWRNRYQHEVDFVLYGENGLFAIEVKLNKDIRSGDLNGIQAFLTDYPKAIPILLYAGKEILKKNEIWVLPIEYFLKQLKPNVSIDQLFKF